jgi:predicted lipid-binding transport protein (Tim44 family)
VNARSGAPSAYSGNMGRMILTILGAILAIWLVFMAIGWIFAMVKTFFIIGLIAVVAFIAVSLLSKRTRRG